MNHALDDVFQLLSLMPMVGNSMTLPDAVRRYTEEVAQRGARAVTESLEDALANIKLDQLDQSRLAREGLEK